MFLTLFLCGVFWQTTFRDLAGVVKRLRCSRADSLKLLLHNFMTGTLFFGAAVHFQSRNFLVSLWLQPDYPIKCRVLPVLLSLCFDLSQSQSFRSPGGTRHFPANIFFLQSSCWLLFYRTYTSSFIPSFLLACFKRGVSCCSPSSASSEKLYSVIIAVGIIVLRMIFHEDFEHLIRVW